MYAQTWETFHSTKKNKIILRQEQIMEISKKKKLLTNFRKSAPFNILGGKSNGMKITGKKFSKHFDTPIKFKGVLFQKNYLEKIFSNMLFCHYKFLKIKVAEHSFQEPKPNSSLLLNHLYFGARFLQESRLTTEYFILAFWLRCVLLPWQQGWLKTRLKNGFCLF